MMLFLFSCFVYFLVIINGDAYIVVIFYGVAIDCIVVIYYLVVITVIVFVSIDVVVIYVVVITVFLLDIDNAKYLHVRFPASAVDHCRSTCYIHLHQNNIAVRGALAPRLDRVDLSAQKESMALKGDLASVDLAQVFQMLALNRKVGMLSIQSPRTWRARSALT